MKKFLAILLSALLVVSAFAISAAAVTWEDGQTREELEDGSLGNYTFDNAYGYEFRIDSVNGTIAAEKSTIITTVEKYNASNPNWSINVLLAPTDDANVYEVVSVIPTPGSAAAGIEKGINFDNGNIVMIIHSGSSAPDTFYENGDECTNWEQKVAAMALKAGDEITFAGVDLAAGTATDATATVQDAPEGYEIAGGEGDESEGDESEEDESTPEVTPVPSENIALNKTYTTSKLFGQDANYHYDPEADPLYAQYKKQYEEQGRRASEDIMGRASALTGGYGNSYGGKIASDKMAEYASLSAEKGEELEEKAYKRQLDSIEGLYSLYSLMSDEEKREEDRQRAAIDFAVLASEMGDDSFIKALGIEPEDDDFQKLKEMAELSAKYGDYSGLEALGIDTSRLTSGEKFDMAELFAKYGDYSVLEALGVDTSDRETEEYYDRLIKKQKVW